MFKRIDDDTLQFNWAQTEAAMCLWEAVLDFTQTKPGDDPAADKLHELWDDVGAYEMRGICASLVPKLLERWYSMSEDERESVGAYDWDFVPGFLLACCLDGTIDEIC